MEDFTKIAIIIPALNPNEKLIELINDLKKEKLENIVVINDGSQEVCNEIFEKLKKDNIKVFVHKENLGKGQALKTGIEKVIDTDIIGIITVDADGQHLAKDVKKVALKLKDDKVILGQRSFNKNVPFTSKIGNVFSTIYYKLLTGIYLQDTQTGLRGIPKKYLKLALEVKGSRYEYEMNFLKEMYYKNISFDTVDIETIYEGRIKNFKIFRDSYKIYRDFFKNILSSTCSAIIDILIFYILISKNNLIFLDNIIARIISGFFDFYINKKFVFNNQDSNQNTFSEMIKYFMLFLIQMLINSILVTILNNYYSDTIIIWKILINLVLYIINFFIKKQFVFKKKYN